MNTAKDLRFESDTLERIKDNVLRRRKAYKHKTTSFDFQRTLEIRDEVETERLEFFFDKHNDARLSVFFWSDRWVLLNAGRWEKPSWVWTWTRQGRLLIAEDDKAINQCIEGSLFHATDDGDPGDALDRIWDGILSADLKSV